METKQIKELIELFESSGLSSMEIEEGNLKVRLAKPATPVVSSPTVVVKPTVVNEEVEEDTPKISITSPLVGTFYRAKTPNDAPYVQVGDRVNVGDVICMIEAMKTMNEIKADKAGIIKEILVENGSMVQYGDELFTLGDN